MKILFIYPAYENLGIEYLSAALKKDNHQTRLILDPVLFADAGGINLPFLAPHFDRHHSIIKEARAFGPQLVCFSCVSDNFRWAQGLSAKIKEHLGVPVVMGGIHPTCVPEDVIKQKEIDYVCVGEGEDAIVGLAKEIAGGSKAISANNIWYKHNGEIVANTISPLRQDLDSLPMADKDLYYRKYGFMFQGYTIITSRGCPHACSYCANSVLRDIYRDKGPYLRRRSVGNVIEELQFAKRTYKSRFVHFCDEVFTYEKKWLEEFIPLYKEKIDLPFACYISPAHINEEIVVLLKEGGCYKSQMGVQSLDEQRRREVLNRNYTNEAIAQTIELFKRHKIYLTCDIILGLPGQDEDELVRMTKFYSINKPDHIETFWLKYYPRTPIIEIGQKMGFINSSQREALERSDNSVGIARGGTTFQKAFVRFQLLLNMLHFMPRSLTAFILRNRLFQFLPAFPPILITVIFRIFNQAKFDLYTSMTFRRYLYFINRRS